MSAEKKSTLVFIPFPVVSHQAAAVKMAKLLVDRDQRLSITIIVMKLPVDTKIGSHSKTSNNTNIPGAAGDSRINFIELPQNDSSFAEFTKSPRSFVTKFIESQKGPVRDAVAEILTDKVSKSGELAGFVLDMFCTPMIDVANDLAVPSYIFFTSSASALGLFFHLQELSDEQNLDLTAFEVSDAVISVPGYLNPVPAKVLPSIVFEKEGIFLNLMRRFRETNGIIINTFLEFEPRAVKSLSGSAADGKIPPVYPVGPIIEDGDDQGRERSGEIINWLDEQPDSSVVFLCFGSRGCFERDQVQEIATALENSGHRFLWSLRKPSPNKENFEFPGEYENPGEVLPDGFLERTVGIGKVIGWAPQMTVLSHPAVGGFVSHCGWNSTLEGVCCNVPMATWPLSAEQQVNAFQLVTEIEMAVEIKMDYRKDCGVIVLAETIEKAVKEMMEPENTGRVKVKMLQEKSRVVMTKGGSSYDFLGSFIENVLDHVS